MTIHQSGTRRIAILQSCYIPWKGYFDIIGSVDTFVIYDDVQYSKNHWHNRNLIKTANGTHWLTIPVSKSAGSFQSIEDVVISQPFAEKHWQTIRQSYSRSPFIREFRELFGELYSEAGKLTRLTDVNLLFIRSISRLLGFDTTFVRSSELKACGGQTERLVNICTELGASHYLSGPAASAYIREEEFKAAGIALEWMDYSGYRPYPQLYSEFVHAISIIDLMFNTGTAARSFMKTPQQETKDPAA